MSIVKPTIIVKIALTGGIASGKTLVSDCFAHLGLAIIDMDVLSREVVKPNTTGLNALVAEFSKNILDAQGCLDRKVLKEILFSNSNNKKKIEAILHPEIIAKMDKAIANIKQDLVIVVVPLLFEKNLTHLFDKFIVVDCDFEIQIKRLMERDDLNLQQAKNILKQQISKTERLAFAKKHQAFLIENNSNKEIIKTQVQSIVNLLTT
jgi:dephospho-CoA kinase